MCWFDFRVLGACALLVSACSDDGVPLTASDTDAAATASAGTGDSAPGTAVTTAPTSDSDTATTDPSGPDTASDTEAGTTDGTGTSAGDTDSGGSSGGSSSTGGTTEPECVMDEDCMLLDDCCSCDAIAVGDEAPKCDILECVSTCASLGLGTPAVQCNFGSCEVEEVSCDPAFVTCDELPPACPDGQEPRVVDGCWTGCVPVEFCDVVPGCDSCSDEEACVASAGDGPASLTCVPIPPSCEGVPSCDCLGEACEDPFTACEDGIDPKSGAELSCSPA